MSRLEDSSGDGTHEEMPGSQDAERYLLRAQHCIDIAKVTEPPRRLILLEMVRASPSKPIATKKNDAVNETPHRLQVQGQRGREGKASRRRTARAI